MTKLIHMRAINNRGPYNPGEDFHVEYHQVNRHKAYAVVVPVQPLGAKPSESAAEPAKPPRAKPSKPRTRTRKPRVTKPARSVTKNPRKPKKG